MEAVAQIKVKSDPESIQTAAEQFLTKTDQERESLIRLVMEGHLRGIIGQLTVEEIVKEPEMVGDRMRSTCAADINKMGLEVISFTIKEVRDKNEYISNMGRPDIARIKRDADVAAAEAERDTAIRRAQALRESAISKAQADQERVLAETLSLTKQSEAQRDLEIKKAQYLETVKRQQAQADKSYEIQTNVMQQQVVAEQVKIQQIEKEHEILVQDAEIQRRERELIATVLKGAEMERRRIETLASAEKQRVIYEAEGHAMATRAVGEAEAEIIFKKGEAEANAMNVKADRVSGIQSGGGGGQADLHDAADCERTGRAAGEYRPDYGGFDGRRHLRHEQSYRRHRDHGRADSGAFRDAVRHENVRIVREGEADRRQQWRRRRS